MAPPNEVLENEPDDRPRYKVHRGCGWDESHPGKDDGEVEVFEDAVGVFPRDEPWEDRSEGADEEEPDEDGVDLSWGELEFGSDDAPHDGSYTEDFGTGADEFILLVGGAHPFDVGEHPRLDT